MLFCGHLVFICVISVAVTHQADDETMKMLVKLDPRDGGMGCT